MQHPPDRASDAPFLPTLRQGLILWPLFLVAHHLGGIFVGAIERSCPGSTWAIALGAVLLSAVLFAAIHLDPVLSATALTSGIFLSWRMAESCNLALPLLGHAAANGVALALLDLRDLSAPLLRHTVSFGILGLSLLVAGTFLLVRTLSAAPRPSLTMGVP